MRQEYHERLEEILPHLENAYDSCYLIMHENTCITAIGEFENCDTVKDVKEQLRKHIPYCPDCSCKYVNYLHKQKRLNESTRELDKKILDVFSHLNSKKSDNPGNNHS